MNGACTVDRRETMNFKFPLRVKGEKSSRYYDLLRICFPCRTAVSTPELDSNSPWPAVRSFSFEKNTRGRGMNSDCQIPPLQHIRGQVRRLGRDALVFLVNIGH